MVSEEVPTSYKYWPHTPETVALFKSFAEKVSEALNRLHGWKTEACPYDYQYGTFLRIYQATCRVGQKSWVGQSMKTIFEYMTTKPDAIEKYGVKWLSHEDIWVRAMAAVWFKNFI